MDREELKLFETTLWAAADQLRGSLDASSYKDVVLGLIFLKYISDKFETKKAEIISEHDLEDAEDPDFYDKVFIVPEKARWNYIAANSNSENIKTILDKAFLHIENENKELKGILPKTYTNMEVDWQKIQELINLFTNKFKDINMSDDILGRVYEYFLGEFARVSGQKGGEFYTPRSVVKLLVDMIEPLKGRVYDPACGSGGMFVSAEKFVESHDGGYKDISVYGQELTATTWRLAKMNLAIRGISANLGEKYADTFTNDQHKELDNSVDYILANPPFNVKKYGLENIIDDPRWKYGVPPSGNANYAWLQHMISKLNYKGVAAVVLANGSLSTSSKKELEIRIRMIKENLIDCIVSLPSNLFYTTSIPASIWIIRKGKKQSNTLFINAENYGEMIDRKVRYLTDANIEEIVTMYHQWLKNDDSFTDKVGISKSASISEIEEKQFTLVPGAYVGYHKEEKSETEINEEIRTATNELMKLISEKNEVEKEVLEAIKKLEEFMK